MVAQAHPARVSVEGTVGNSPDRLRSADPSGVNELILMRYFLAFGLLLALVHPVVAGQAVIAGYDTARDDYFWTRLYVFGDVTIYCGHVFRSEAELQATGDRRQPQEPRRRGNKRRACLSRRLDSRSEWVPEPESV